MRNEIITHEMKGYQALRDLLHEWSHLMQISFDFFHAEQFRTKQTPTKGAYDAYLEKQVWIQQMPKGMIMRLARYCLRYYRAYIRGMTESFAVQDYYVRILMVRDVQHKYPCVLTVDEWRHIVGTSSFYVKSGKWVTVTATTDVTGYAAYSGEPLKVKS